MNECEKWLYGELKNQFAHYDNIREKAKEKGFSKKQLKEARKILGVKTFHQFDEDGATPNWFLEL